MEDYKTGDLVSVKTKDGEKFQGKIMPSVDKNIFVLKLKSGYNIGIDKAKINEVGILSSAKKENIENNNIEQNPKLKKILILHTGGTLASKVSYSTGGVVSSFSPEEILNMVPELASIANIQTRLVRNMFSEDMNFNHYNILAKEIEIELAKQEVSGIIITHGTDTLHYTAAALSFMLQGLSIPVLIVGAQRSSDRGSSDAFLNLVCACQFIVNSNFKGIGICMHSDSSDEKCLILHGVNSRKMHSSRRDAFKNVNINIIAEVFKDGHIAGYKKHESENKFRISYLNEKLKIGILKAHPGLSAEEILFYKNFDGLVIEGTGLGHIGVNQIDEFTTENLKVFDALKEICHKMPVIMTTQCIFGIVNMNVYETGRKLIGIGVLGNFSTMTTETAFVKLAWLLSNHRSEVRKMISENICGEISDRVGFEEEIV